MQSFSKAVLLVISVADLGAVGGYARTNDKHDGQDVSIERGIVLKGDCMENMRGMLTLAGLFFLGYHCATSACSGFFFYAYLTLVRLCLTYRPWSWMWSSKIRGFDV